MTLTRALITCFSWRYLAVRLPIVAGIVLGVWFYMVVTP